MFVDKKTIALVGSADGTGTFYSEPIQYGKVLSVTYIKDADAPLAATTDIVITAESTAQAILSLANVNATATYAPRQAVIVNTSGAALLYSAGNPVEDYIFLSMDRIKVIIAEAGAATLKGTIVVLIG